MTDEHGHFRVLSPSAPGAFDLYAELEGFQAIRYEFTEGLSSGTELAPFVMGIACVCETISVSVGGPPPGVRLPTKETELPPGGSVVSPSGSQSSGSKDSRRFAYWLDELGLEGMHVPKHWVRTRRGLSIRVAAHLGESERSDRDVLEMYVAAREVLDPNKWLAAETARALSARRPAVAARIASELIEHDAEQPGVARTLAQLLDAWDRRELVEPLLLRALEQAPHEPQSYFHWIRFGYRGPHDGAWDWVRERRSELPPLQLRNDVAWAFRSVLGRRMGTEAQTFTDAGLQVELAWDARSVDLDLELVEPLGHRARHRNRSTRATGWLSSNQRSYGPEVYMIRNPTRGTYLVRVRYVRSGQMELETDSLGIVTIYRRISKDRVERRAYPIVLGAQHESWEIPVRLGVLNRSNASP